MAHRPKIETLNQQIQRDYHVKTSGAASKILARLTKQLFGKAIKDKDLTPAQRSDVLGLIITDSMERNKKLCEQGDTLTSKKENELNITQLDTDKKQTSELNITQLENDAPPVESKGELNITQLDTGKKQTSELNITHYSSDKFISINYRREDNTRYTVQIEQFYIDALIAIGITDISRFVAENAGVTTVTKNVKRSIVNELVKRATKQK